MDDKRARVLLEANLDKVLAGAADPAATMGALTHKIGAEIEAIEAQLATIDARIGQIPAELRDQQAIVYKCDAIIAKATDEEKHDLANAAVARKKRHEAAVAALQNELAEAEAQVERGRRLIGDLDARRDDIVVRQATAELDGAQDRELASASAASRPTRGAADLAPALEVPQPMPASAEASAIEPPVRPSPSPQVSPSPTPAAAAPTPPAAAAATDGGGADALEDEFAALLAGMDDADLGGLAPSDAAEGEDEEDLDAILAGLPEMVTVAEGELPDDAQLPDQPPPKAPKILKPVSAPAPDAAQGAAEAPAASTAAKPKRSRALWWIVGGTAVAGGGTVATLWLLGVF